MATLRTAAFSLGEMGNSWRSLGRETIPSVLHFRKITLVSVLGIVSNGTFWNKRTKEETLVIIQVRDDDDSNQGGGHGSAGKWCECVESGVRPRFWV